MSRQIEDLVRQAAQRSDVIALGGGLPAPAQFPRRQLAAAFAGVVHSPADRAWQYGWPEGELGLRTFVAKRLRARGAFVEPDDVVMTSGAQQALQLVGTLLKQRAARLGVQPESYPSALTLFRGLGYQLGGLTSAAEVLYLMPAISNPRGERLTASQREMALSGTQWLIEDDAYADLAFDGTTPRPLLADVPERVFHVGTFSKTLAPGLRVGWLVAPRSFRRRVRNAKRDADLQAGGLAQAVVEAYLRLTDFDARLRRLRRFYQKRATRLHEAVTTCLPGWRCGEPAGGFSLWLETDARPDMDEGKLLARAIECGVSFDPGSSFRHDSAHRPMALRLCHSYAPEDQLQEGVRRLAKAWRGLATSRQTTSVPGTTMRHQKETRS